VKTGGGGVEVVGHLHAARVAHHVVLAIENANDFEDGVQKTDGKKQERNVNNNFQAMELYNIGFTLQIQWKKIRKPADDHSL